MIDYRRKEQRHSGALSLDMPSGEEELSLGDSLTDGKNHTEELTAREATRAEIEELARQMEEFGVKLSDVADNCPRQRRTMETCRKALEYAKENSDILDEFLRTKRLPLARMSEGGGADRKTLERHRKYMVALLLIYTNGYEIIRGHLKQVMKGVAGQ